MQRFLLLATPRTASTTVLRTLERHPQVVGERELLHSPDWKGANRFWLKLWRRMPALLLSLRAAVVSARRRRPVYGVSVFPQHVRDIAALARQLQATGWTIMALQRRSLFDQAISYAVAEHTRRWHRGRGQLRELPQVNLRPASFLQQARWLNAQRNLLVRAVSGLPHEPIWYEQDLASLVAEQALFQRLQVLLRVPPLELVSAFGKTWDQPYEEIVLNYDELRALPLETMFSPPATDESHP